MADVAILQGCIQGLRSPFYICGSYLHNTHNTVVAVWLHCSIFLLTWDAVDYVELQQKGIDMGIEVQWYNGIMKNP